MKFTLNDTGVFIESDAVEWQNYRLIDMAVEYGFSVNRSEYEVAVALLRANAIDDSAAEWFSEVSTEALSYLNEECVYPGMIFSWYDGELFLVPDFEYDVESIVGPWHPDDVSELYGVSVDTFEVVLRHYDLSIEYIDDNLFKVVD